MSATTINNQTKSSYRDGLKMMFNPSALITGATVFLGAIAMLPECDTATAAQTSSPDPIILLKP